MRTFTHLVDVGGAPGHIPSGLRAQQGVNTHIQGPTCAQHTTPETVAPKTQTTSPATPHFQHISPKWSVFWALHHPKPQPRRHQPGGNYAIQASDTPTTRRKKASHGAKPPIATSVEGTEEHRTRMLRPRWRQGMARLRDDAPISDPAPLVWRAPEGPAAVPVGGGRDWPGFEPTRQTYQHTRNHWRGGRRRDLPRCRWAEAGTGRASRRRAERSSRRGRLAGGPPPTGTHSGRALRRPEHPWGHTATQHHHNRTHNETRPRPVSRPRPRHSVSATHRSSGTSSDQAVMST